MCKSCGYSQLLSDIDELLNDDALRYVFASDTLTGIQDTVSKTGHATERQTEAVENIRRSKC